jgi:hypothetical protein
LPAAIQRNSSPAVGKPVISHSMESIAWKLAVEPSNDAAPVAQVLDFIGQNECARGQTDPRASIHRSTPISRDADYATA